MIMLHAIKGSLMNPFSEFSCFIIIIIIIIIIIVVVVIVDGKHLRQPAISLASHFLFSFLAFSWVSDNTPAPTGLKGLL